MTRIRLNTHYFLSAALAVAILPLFELVHLPFSVSWQRLILVYWVGLALRAVLAALIMGLIGLPTVSTLRPICSHFSAHKKRLWLFCAFPKPCITECLIRSELQ